MGGVTSNQNSPVDDAFLVQEHECGDDFCSIETSPCFIKTTRLLNVEHQVAPIHKFHHKKQTILDTSTRKDPINIGLPWAGGKEVVRWSYILTGALGKAGWVWWD